MDLRGAVHRLRYLCQGAPPTPASAGKRFLQRLLPTRGASCSGTHAPAADRPLHEPVLLVFRTFNAGLVITPVVVVMRHALLCLAPVMLQKCPFDAIMIINLPKNLEGHTTHRYGPNSFKLHR